MDVKGKDSALVGGKVPKRTIEVEEITESILDSDQARGMILAPWPGSESSLFAKRADRMVHADARQPRGLPVPVAELRTCRPSGGKGFLHDVLRIGGVSRDRHGQGEEPGGFGRCHVLEGRDLVADPNRWIIHILYRGPADRRADAHICIDTLGGRISYMPQSLKP